MAFPRWAAGRWRRSELAEQPRFSALLVDYGGVMTSSVSRAFAEFCVREGIDPERFKAVVAEAYGAGGSTGVMARLERGEIALDEFERWMARTLSEGLEKPLAPEGIQRRMNSGLEPDDRMIEVVLRLRSRGVRTGLVSNSWGKGVYERERLGDLFDAVLISGEMGARKPEPEMYLLAAERLGVDPRECVFVDDLLQNVEGARAVGMEAFIHRSAEFTIPKLEELFGVALD
jgi:epoxide hydrolase-like predicted phosphatase